MFAGLIPKYEDVQHMNPFVPNATKIGNRKVPQKEL